MLYQFGEWQVDTSSNEVRRDGESKRLQPMVFAVLEQLLLRPGEIVTVEDLMANVWQGRAIEPGGVARNVAQIRRALEDEASDSKYIETISKKGYRTVASVALSSESSRVHAPTAQESEDSQRSIGPTLLVTLGLLVFVVGYWWSTYRDGSDTASQGVPSKDQMTVKSIAVLPFENLSATSEHDYLVNGLVTELTQTLAGIPRLRVASNRGVSYLQDEQLKLSTIGRELNVQYIVEGSVRLSNSRLRLSIQLTDLSQGFQIWSNSYEREFSDLFHLQVDLSRAIVSELPLLVGDEHFSNAVQAGTTNPAAYDSMLRGWEARQRIRTPEDLEQAIDYFRTATQKDPYFYDAHASLAAAIAQRTIFAGGGNPHLAMNEAIGILENIDRLDVNHSRKNRSDHLLLLHNLNWDWPGMEEIISLRLIQPGPEASYYFQYGHLLRDAGLSQPALAFMERAEDMEPLNLSFKLQVGIVLYNSGAYEKAIQKMDECLSLKSDNGWCNSYKGAAFAKLGNAEEALKMLGVGVWDSRSNRCIIMLELGKECDVSKSYDTVVTANVRLAVLSGDYNEAFRWVNHAIDTRNPMAVQFRAQTQIWPDAFHNDPRWHAALERTGQTNEWRDEVCRRAQALEPYTDIAVECPNP